MPRNDRYVVNNPGGGWAVRKPNADRASELFDNQQEAINRGREIVRNLGGGELRIQGRDGRWRDSDSVPNGNDPFPPRG